MIPSFFSSRILYSMDVFDWLKTDIVCSEVSWLSLGLLGFRFDVANRRKKDYVFLLGT